MRTTVAERMHKHWTITLKLAPSEPLEKSWRMIEQAILKAANGTDHWQVLPLPTGSGKTEALKVLCATYGADNLLGFGRFPALDRSFGLNPIPGGDSLTGILIVTRFQDEADKLAIDMNRLANKEVAGALHSTAPMADRDITSLPVLIITHAAYKLALQEILNTENRRQWELYMNFHHIHRSCVVIDEAFDWVDTESLNLSEVRSMAGDLCGRFEGQVRIDLTRLLGLAVTLTGSSDADRTDQVLTQSQYSTLSGIDFYNIIEATKTLTNANLDQWGDRDRLKDQSSLISPHGSMTQFRTCYLRLLRQLQTIVKMGHAWRSKRGGKAMLHSSRSLLSSDGTRGVILDATAEIDPTYTLAGDEFKVLARPTGIRSYKNVTLYASYGHAVGKEHLKVAAVKEWPLLQSQLTNRLSAKRSLICVHKDVVPVIQQNECAGSTTETAYWGNMDGKNDWSHCDAGILFGLPYWDDITPTQIFFAYQGPQSADWFAGNRKFGLHTDIRTALADGFTARSVVQAINRTGCRSPIDAEGNCKPTHLYALLPNTQTGRTVVAGILSQMPGLKMADWAADAATRKARKPPTDAKLIAFFEKASPGEHSRADVSRVLRINGNSLERLVTRLRKTSTNVAQALATLSVQYHSPSGRGKEAYFTKG